MRKVYKKSVTKLKIESIKIQSNSTDLSIETTNCGLPSGQLHTWNYETKQKLTVE